MKTKNQLRRERKKQLKAAELGAPPPEEAKQTEETDAPPKKSKVTALARKFDWINEESPLYDMYAHVSSRFKRKHSDDDAESAENKTLATTKPEFSEGETAPQSTDGEREIQSGMSRKQLRKINKPSLAELKQMTARPELIDWYDADAAHPEFLVYMKTLPHAVQVPPNWCHRSEIPQFGARSAYELPLNIVETKIREARKDDKLDVDYELLQAAFFSPESSRVALDLLPYGSIVDLKLRKSFKPSSKNRHSKAEKPGPLSSRLRSALGLKADDPVPWEAAVDQKGPAPGYANAVLAHQEESAKKWGALR